MGAERQENKSASRREIASTLGKKVPACPPRGERARRKSVLGQLRSASERATWLGQRPRGIVRHELVQAVLEPTEELPEHAVGVRVAVGRSVLGLSAERGAVLPDRQVVGAIVKVVHLKMHVRYSAVGGGADVDNWPHRDSSVRMGHVIRPFYHMSGLKDKGPHSLSRMGLRALLQPRGHMTVSPSASTG